MLLFLKRHVPQIILAIAVAVYISYFSFFSILRYQKMYAHYFDLGIMHQTVYNTYMSMKTGDLSRFLEMTDPHNTPSQVKRMSVHNDIFLAIMALFYFIHEGPETLLVIQSIVSGIGAMFVYLIAQIVLPTKSSNKSHVILRLLPLVLSLSYLLYAPVQKGNVFEFHAVTLATTFILAMYYFFLVKRYVWSGLFALLTISTKEQVGLTLAFFAGSMMLGSFKTFRLEPATKKTYLISVFIGGIVWTFLSLQFIIPYFRGSEHFASSYHGYLKENPFLAFPMIFRGETYHYLRVLFAPLAFFSLLSPWHLAILIPELAVTILSKESNLRNFFFHYQAVITPFVFISAIYGIKNAVSADLWVAQAFVKKYSTERVRIVLCTLLVAIGALVGSYKYSALPFAHSPDLIPLTANRGELQKEVDYWRMVFQNDSIKLSSTGQLSPHFTSRRYFYEFKPQKFMYADIIVINTDEVAHDFQKEDVQKAYNSLLSDWKYIKMYESGTFQIFKRT